MPDRGWGPSPLRRVRLWAVLDQWMDRAHRLPTHLRQRGNRCRRRRLFRPAKAIRSKCPARSMLRSLGRFVGCGCISGWSARRGGGRSRGGCWRARRCGRGGRWRGGLRPRGRLDWRRSGCGGRARCWRGVGHGNPALWLNHTRGDGHPGALVCRTLHCGSGRWRRSWKGKVRRIALRRNRYGNARKRQRARSNRGGFATSVPAARAPLPASCAHGIACPIERFRAIMGNQHRVR